MSGHGTAAARALAAAVASFLARPAGADLPIHCTLADAVGEWTFHVGPPQPVHGALPACGHSLPNSVASMLKINHSSVVPPSAEETLSITLTEEIVEHPERHLRARDGSGREGMWTMVYDTGFEIRVGGRSLTAHFFFDELRDSMPMNGDNWEDIGKYYGRKDGQNYLDAGGATYACHCDVTSTGWWSRRAEGGGQEAGCLWATKSGLVKPGASLVDWLPTRSPASSLVRLRHGAAPGRPALGKAAGAAAGVGSFAVGEGGPGAPIGLDADASGGTAVKEVLRLGGNDRWTPAPGGGATRRAVSLRGVSAHPAASAGRGNESTQALGIVKDSSRQRELDRLPANFDWREELAGMVPPGQDPLAEQSDQGPCGSCYAFAGIMVLQMRFRVQLYKQHGILYPLELSYKSPTRCSPYTEGCNGGFSYFIFRLASEVGVPLAGCDQQVPAGALQQTCDWKCYNGNEELFYAKDYWHVGGFSHGSSEERIMREIYENGPVELAFSTTAVPEFVKLSGQSAKDDTDVMTVVLNDKAPKERYSSNPSVHRWWFATHAILAVGWGEETVKWGMVKYWTVRNSWGRDWGEGGYAKMRRGNNDGGAENDASMVVPDLSRLPAGFLEKAKQYHADHEANRRLWRASAEASRSAPLAGHNRGGVPDYCKTRPDSIDCQ